MSTPIRPADLPIGEQIRDLYAQTGQRLAIDEDCPACGWGERWFNGTSFGCNKCPHTGDYRNT